MKRLQNKLNYLLYFLIALFLSSCSCKSDEYFKRETITTQLEITDVYKAKYSKVKGSIIYNGVKVHVDNGGDGYYYKEYDLRNGQRIDVNLSIYYYSTSYGYELVFGDVDVSSYELN